MKSRNRTALASCFCFVAAGVASLVVVSCSSTKPVIVGVSHSKTAGSSSVDAPPVATVPVLGSERLASMKGGSGPYLVHNGDHGLAVYSAPDAKGSPFWYSVPVDASGKLRGTPKAVATAPPTESITLTSLRPLGGDGFLLVWARKVTQGEVVEALAMGEDGSLRGLGSVLLAQGAEPVIWADAVPTERGAHVYVVHERNNHEGRVSVVSLDAQGKAASAPRVVLPIANAWQPASAGAGSVLLAVRADGAASGGIPRGTVIAVPVDEAGKNASEPVPVSAPGVADLDVDAATLGGTIYVAWTDRRDEDGQVTVAGIDALGTTTSPGRAVVSSAGDQAMIGITATTPGGTPSLLVAWDDIAARDRNSRLVQLTSLDTKLVATGGPVTLPFASRDGLLPNFVGTSDGFVSLTLARSCLSAAATCTPGPTPAYVWFDTQLRIRGGAPVLPDVLAGNPPAFAFAPSCSSSACVVFAADERESTDMYLTRLSSEEAGWKSVSSARNPAERPSLASAGAIASGARLADLASVKVTDRILVASVTEFIDGSRPPPLPSDVDAKVEAQKDRDPKNPRSAVVAVQSLDGAGVAQGKASTITLRGLSTAGVAMAPSTNGKDACVGWAAKDRGIAQVFLTRVGPDGKRNAQQMVTSRLKGDVGDIAIAAVDDGWMVSWIDTRDGNAEVYAMRVDHDLHKKPEQRITNAPGDASEVTLLVREKDVLAAYSDARTKGDPSGDVFLSRLDRTTAAKVGDETRLATTPTHARSIHLAPLGADTLIAWIEQSTGKGAEAPNAVHATRLDGTGVARALPSPVEGLSGAGSLGLSCQRDGCRIVVTKASDEGAMLFGASWAGQVNVVALHRLLPLFSGPEADVAPTLIDDMVILGDLASPPPSDEGRVRRIKLVW